MKQISNSKQISNMNSLLSIVGTNTTNNIELLNWGKRLGIIL